MEAVERLVHILHTLIDAVPLRDNTRGELHDHADQLSRDLADAATLTHDVANVAAAVTAATAPAAPAATGTDGAAGA